MLVSDEHDLGSAFDSNFLDFIELMKYYLDFDLSDSDKFLSSVGKNDERKITVTNVSNRVTTSQLQSFFSKFGKVRQNRITLNFVVRYNPVICRLMTDANQCMPHCQSHQKSL
jgi:RNA recognition motif-containing protein